MKNYKVIIYVFVGICISFLIQNQFNTNLHANNIDDDISDTIIKFLSCQNDYFNSLYSHVHTNRFLNKELKQIILGNIQKILFNRYIIRKTIKNHVFKKRKFI